MSRFLAIDVDQGSVHVVVGSARGSTARLEKALTVSLGEALNPGSAADLGRHFREALKSAGIAAAPTVAVVGRDRVIVKDFKIPSGTGGDEPSVVRFQASKEMTESPDSVALDYFTLDRPEPDGQLRAVTASIRKDMLAAYRTFCNTAGLKLAGLSVRPLGTLASLDRAIATGAVTAPEGKRASVAVLSRGEKWGELVIARDGQVVFARAITATALSSEPALLGELRRNLAVYNGQNPQQTVEALYVAEASGPASGWSGRLQAGLSIPVQAFDPLAGVEHETAPEARGHFAALAGLLQLKSQSKPLPIDFASPRQAVAKDANKKKLLAMAASVLAILIIGGLGFGFIRVQQKQTELTKLIKEKNKLDKLRREVEEDEKRVKAFRDWDATRVNWLDEIYDMSARFPDTNTTRLEQFRAEPLTPPKNSKLKYVARIFLKVNTADGRQVDSLQTSMQMDKRYFNIVRQTKGGATAGANRFGQSEELRADIEKRPSNEYIRKLTATAPPRRGRESDDSFDGGDEEESRGNRAEPGNRTRIPGGFGGGFGGNPGGRGGFRGNGKGGFEE